jgi:endonuclease/exonuclease/phosphatase family metal-dependent hydrolase
MLYPSHLFWRALLGAWLFLAAIDLKAQTPVVIQTNATVRIMAANLNGNTQSYQPFAIHIFQGLKPDVVAIQEFDYTSTNGLGVNTPTAMREMVDAAFGTNFSFFREPITQNGPIPNGVISRYPIIASGSWADVVQTQPNRGYAWAQIAIPGTNNLYVVSAHLLTSSAANRNLEAVNLKGLMESNFPPNALVVLAGDFNPDSRTEACMVTFETYLSDFPIPTDAVAGGNSFTSINRNHPHDYVLPSFSMTNLMTASVFPSHAFSNGLVFDSRVYTPLSDVPPALQADSGNAQHMAVMKDFKIPFAVTNFITNLAPANLTFTAPNLISWQGVSNTTYTVQGSSDLSSSNWTTLGTATSSTTNFSFTNSAPDPIQQFYRITHP